MFLLPLGGTRPGPRIAGAMVAGAGVAV